MTASATIFVQEANDALKVPMQALLFKPDQTLMATYMKQLPEEDHPQNSAWASEAPKDKEFGQLGGGAEGNENNNSDVQRVWVKNGVMVHPVKVETGINDGTDVQILSGLKKGEKVVLSMSEKKLEKSSTNKEASSPFMPTPPGRRNRNKK